MAKQPKFSILNVDDSMVGRYTTTRTLQQAGFEVKEAATGAEALQLAAQKSEQPDLIILDISLPDMSGFEICRQIKTNPETCSIPVLHLSARFISSEDKIYGLDSGADGYLVQPVEPLELIATVRALLRVRHAEEIANNIAKEWQTTFDAISDGVCLVDSAGKVLRCNQAIVDIFQKKFHEVINQSFSEIATTVFDAPEINFFPHLKKAEHRQILELSNSKKWFRVTVDPVFNQRGNWNGSVYIFADITEHKRLEKALQQRAQELEEANRIKDEFLATLSHELRTPLNSILGWAKLLRNRKFDQVTIERALEIIERNSRVQSQLIEDILDVSRIITGKHRLNIRPVKILGVIEASLNSLRPAAEAKGIEIQTEFLPPIKVIQGDSDRLQQVMWNLLSNAIKFTSNGGKINIRCEQINSNIEIQVSDTGKGITKEFLPYIFQPFRQQDGTTTRSHSGLGLGLAIVRHLVELHGGTIQADSRGEGMGATLTIKLPVVADFSQLDDQQSEGLDSQDKLVFDQLASLNDWEILVVDDDLDSRDFLNTVLSECHANVTVANSVAEAINILNDLVPDVIISDIGMPDEDGYDFIHKLKDLSVENNLKIPAIALTAYARPEDRQRALNEGFDEHISKPVEPIKLIELMINLVNK